MADFIRLEAKEKAAEIRAKAAADAAIEKQNHFISLDAPEGRFNIVRALAVSNKVDKLGRVCAKCPRRRMAPICRALGSHIHRRLDQEQMLKNYEKHACLLRVSKG